MLLNLSRVVPYLTDFDGNVVSMMRKNTSIDDDLADISPLLNYDESGLYLRKSATWVREEVYAGRLVITRIGKTPYITKDELDRYIAERVESGDTARRPGTGLSGKRRAPSSRKKASA
jgi:hypothetical protein